MSVRREIKTLTVYYGPSCGGKSTLAQRTGAPCFSVRQWSGPLRGSLAFPTTGTLLDDAKVFAAVQSFLKENEAAEHIVFDDFPGNAVQLDWVMTELSGKRRIDFHYVHVDWKTALCRTLARKVSIRCDRGLDSIAPVEVRYCPICGGRLDYHPDDTEGCFQKRWQDYFVRMREMYRQDRFGLFRASVDASHNDILRKGLRMDLHLHTTASDGTDSPAEIINRAATLGIGLCAVTDHDTVSGLAEARESALRLGLALLPGIEISALWKGQLVHLLGYGIDPKNIRLRSVTEHNREVRQKYDVRVLRKLESKTLLPFGTEDRYTGYKWCRRRGGWKLLNFLMDAGLCQDGFDYLHLIGQLDVGGIPFLPAEEVIEVVHDSGLCVLAHPGAYGWQAETLSIHLEELRKAGIDGVECRHPQNSSVLTEYLLDYCTRWGLLSTGGSDEHGNLPDRALGTPQADTRMLGSHPVKDKIIWADK